MDIILTISKLEDPRMERTKRHRLEDVLFLCICGTIAGCDSLTEIETFGETHLAWLRQYVPLAGGVPSHDTLGRVLARVDPQALSACLNQCVQNMHDLCAQAPTHLAIDGKTLRRSARHGPRTDALHVVSAWSSEHQLSYGEVSVDHKSNEITAIPELLDILSIKDCVVTIDAMGCQKSIAGRIVDKGGAYILTLKNNHWLLCEEVKDCFARFQPEPQYEQTECTKGETETRRLAVLRADTWLTEAADWPGLQTVVQLERRRGTTVEIRYFISSLPPEYDRWAQVIRQHWAIENDLHWQLDVSFREDASAISVGNAPHNMNILRKTALSLIKQDKSTKGSVKNKRLRAGWDHRLLENILHLT